MSIRIPMLVAVVAVACVAACGGPTVCTNCTSPPPALEISCPSDVTIAGAPPAGQTVTYASPVTTAGTPPVTSTCSPASGSVFPVGATSVGCTAHDAIGQSAVCSFHVTLTTSHLGAMRFVAFGDSITAGENGIPAGDPNPVNCGPVSASAPLATQRAIPEFIDVTKSYPTQLLGLLNARFVGEAFVMINEGLRGELAADGVRRLSPCVFQIDRPDVLFLLEGINDLIGFNYDPSQSQSQGIVNDLSSDASAARSAGVSFVFVSTILPVERCPDPNNCQIHDAVQPNHAIDQTNAIILAGIPGATIVDGNAAFRAADPSLASLISTDGLHPSSAGYKVLAQAYMDAIVSHIPITSLHRVPR
jgi:lysophospholipase L1-like esterase